MQRHLFIQQIVVMIIISLLIGCHGSNGEVDVQETVAVTNKNSEDKEHEVTDAVSTSEPHGLTVTEKLEDFDYLFEILSENYPYFHMNKRIHDIDWVAQKDDHTKKIQNTEGDLEFYIALNSIMSDLNHGHARVFNNRLYGYAFDIYESTMLEPWLAVLEDPVVQRRYWKKEGQVGDARKRETVSTTGNVMLEKWADTSTAYMGINSFDLFYIENDGHLIKTFLEDLEDFDSLIIDIRGNTGGSTKYWTQYLVPALINEQVVSYQYLCFRGGAYAERFITHRLGYDYAELNAIDDDFLTNLSGNVPDEIRTEFDYYYERRKTIEPVAEEGYSGDIYLLVDRYVASSSEDFLQFVRDTNMALIIGEFTSGETSGFDSLLLRLPNSGYVIQFPGAMLLNSTGMNVQETKVAPDIHVEGSEALKKAKELIERRYE